LADAAVPDPDRDLDRHAGGAEAALANGGGLSRIVRRLPFSAGVGLFAAYSYLATVIAVSWFLRRDYGADLPVSLLWAALLYAPWLLTGGLVWRVLRRFGAEGRAMAVLTAVAPPVIVIASFAAIWLDRRMRGADWSEAELLNRVVDRLPVSLLLYTAIAAAGLAAAHWRRVIHQRREMEALSAALAEARRAQSEADAGPAERLMVSVGQARVPVDACDIEWIASAGNYAVVHWRDREGLLRETLQALETRLAPRGFARSHRSTLINLARVRALKPLSDGAWRVTLDSGAELVVSRSYRDGFMARLGRD
jgi:DNA-binding LytR/AlgR family response regulator